MRACMHARMHPSIDPYIQIHMCTHACMHHTYVHACIRTFIQPTLPRYVHACAQTHLHKSLASLKLCCGLAGTEHENACLVQSIHDAGGQGVFGSNHHKIDRVLFRPLDHLGDVGHADPPHTFGNCGYACIPRQAVQGPELGRLLQLPAQRVLCRNNAACQRTCMHATMRTARAKQAPGAAPEARK